MAQAVRLALHYGEDHLGVTDVFGEDVGPPLGGVFTVTQGLRTAWNSPLDERGVLGTAMGVAYAGGRPVAEVQFCDYIFNCIDLLMTAGNQRWSGAGQFEMPIVVMTPVGAGVHGSIYHSHSFEGQASRLAGWKVLCPSDPLDAYGLTLSAIVDPNPVLLLLPKALLRVKGTRKLPGEPEDDRELCAMIDAPVSGRAGWSPRWPEIGPSFVPIGESRRVREGDEATVVSYGRTLPLCVEAADRSGARCDVIDLRTIFPYDWPAVRESVKRTGRLLVVNEDTEVTNFAEHVLRRVVDECFYELVVRPRLVMGKHVPGVGIADAYEEASVPGAEDVFGALRGLLEERA